MHTSDDCARFILIFLPAFTKKFRIVDFSKFPKADKGDQKCACDRISRYYSNYDLREIKKILFAWKKPKKLKIDAEVYQFVLKIVTL